MKTEASEYLSLLQEIQNNNVSTFTVMPADEPRFTIETNSRNIIVPSEFSFLSVQNDHRAETIYFEIDRYFDNVDLSQHACVVQFINKSGTTINEGTYPVTSMDIDSVDGKIVFGWEIRNDATQLTGDITFSVRFYSIDNNGNFTYNFNTLTASSYILPSLNIIASGERITATELEVWTDKMNNLASSIESDIITVEEKIEELENYIASIPEDYTALTEEVGKLSEDIATKASAIKEKASGELIVVTDSDEAKPLGLAIDGKSYQKQYSGKNLLDFNSIMPKSIKVSFVNDVLTLIGDGSNPYQHAMIVVTDLIKNNAGKSLSFACDNSVRETSGSTIIQLKVTFDDGTNVYHNFHTIATDWFNTYTIPIDVSNVKSAEIGFYCNNTSELIANTLTITKPILYFGTVDDKPTYEPYCGGKPSPNPSYPQEISNIGVYDEASGKYAVEVKCTGKNLLKNNAVSNTKDGITFTVNENGSVTANGTAIAECYLELRISKDLRLKSGNYILSGCPSDGSGSTFFLETNANGWLRDYGKGITFTINEDVVDKRIYITIKTGMVCNNVVFKPMIRYAEITDDTYEPYKETTATVLLDEPLRKGDKAYWNGGSKVRVDRNRAVKVFDGSENWKKSDATGRYRASLVGVKYISEADMPIVLSNRYIAIIGNDYLKYTQGISSSNEYMYIVNNEIQTVEEFKSILAENPITVEYELATPITEEIDIDLGELTMFYPTTILSNDCNANMEVEYIADTKAYIDKKFAELATAMV